MRYELYSPRAMAEYGPEARYVARLRFWYSDEDLMRELTYEFPGPLTAEWGPYTD